MNNIADHKYGFGGRLRPEFPSQVVVDITEVCNLACIHCIHEEFTKSSNYSAAYLDPQLNKKLVDEIKMNGTSITQYIRYTSNGEPLIHPESYEMIRYAISNSGVFVTLTTNGTILNENKMIDLLKSGLHMIDISIDAFKPETYAKIRINGNLERTAANVQKLISMVKETGATTKIVTSFIQQPLNIDETSEFAEYWKANGADAVVVRRLHSCAGAIAETGVVTDKNSQADRKPCLYPWERIILNSKGFLSFCPNDWSHSSDIADYRNSTIKEIWSGSYYDNLRQSHLLGNFDSYLVCHACTDWETTRWPWEGKSYADMIEKFKETNTLSCDNSNNPA